MPIKNIYKHVKLLLYKNIDYSLYYNIIKKFFEILIRDVAERDHKVYLPNQMGYVYLDEKPHTRAFHVRVDNKATKETGETVFYKVPILDDFYKKLDFFVKKEYKKNKTYNNKYALKHYLNNEDNKAGERLYKFIKNSLKLDNNLTTWIFS